MRNVFAIFSCFLFITNIYACPELDGVDLADGDDASAFTVLNTSKVHLTEEEFHQLDVFNDFDYSECSHALKIKKIKSTSGQHIYNALVTYKDECDGGNSYGVLYNENMSKILAVINDSFIYCRP